MTSRHPSGSRMGSLMTYAIRMSRVPVTKADESSAAWTGSRGTTPSSGCDAAG
jgi:hypothetical protein